MLEPLELRMMLVVADLAANLHFYETLLGLRRVMAWNDRGGGAILSLGPGRTLELRGRAKGDDPDAAGPLAAGRLMLGVAVAAVDAAHAALVAAGVPVARELKDNPWGDRSFAVTDPNGIRVWVYQITDPDLAHNLLE